MSLTTTPYEPRPIRFLELWAIDGWRIKVYGIGTSSWPTPRKELVVAGKDAARERLATVPETMRHYSVGFLGIHEGRTSNFVFIDWWADENELHHHVYVSPTAKPAQLVYMTPTGLAACVWDLRLIAFERQAWIVTVLNNSAGGDVEAYLQQHLNEDA
jgi:hypothetical protein